MARYIPILRWKEGEWIALQQLSPAGRANVAPLIVLTSDQYRETRATRTRAAAPAAATFVADLVAAWGTSPFFLDASGLGDGRPPSEGLGVRPGCKSIDTYAGGQSLPPTPHVIGRAWARSRT